MRDRALFILVIVYATVWIVTFGHAVNRPVECDHDYIKDEWTREYLRESCRNLSELDAFVFSMFWPFYWSAQAFRGAA